MGRKQISMWVDEEILRGFDTWCWEHHLSRTQGVVGLMRMNLQVDSELWEKRAEALVGEIESETRPRRGTRQSPRPAPPCPPAVIEELRERIAQVKERCPHPKDKRIVFTWGAKCGECNDIVK